MKYILKIKINKDIAHKYYDDHRHAYDGDSGIDLFTAETVYVPAHARSFKINLGVSLEMLNSETKENVSYLLIARSSLALTNLRLCNGVGLIDAGFRGNLYCMVDNLSDKGFYVASGIRLVQVCAPSFEPMKLFIVKELSEGTRGDKGLGSSGRAKM